MKKIGRSRQNYHSGTKITVVKYDPVKRFVMRILIPLLVVAFVALSYYLGGYYVWSELEFANGQYTKARGHLSECQSIQNELKQKLAMQAQSGNVDRNAAEQVRQGMRELKEVNAQLKKELSLYREVLAPKSQDTISVQQFELLPTSDFRRFQWKLVLAQTAARHPFQRGVAELFLIGRKEGREVTIPVHKISSQVAGSRIPVGFRYYQSIPGDGGFADLLLPDNFRPEYFQITVNIENPKKSRINKRFNWLSEEAGTYVGKTTQESRI